jgi:hypothetical protein
LCLFCSSHDAQTIVLPGFCVKNYANVNFI